VGHHLRQLGFFGNGHSAADSDVIQTPLVLLAGLGEVSRIGTSSSIHFWTAAEDRHFDDRLADATGSTDRFRSAEICSSCNKCARECPSGAISAGPKVMFQRHEIWKADVEKCTDIE